MADPRAVFLPFDDGRTFVRCSVIDEVFVDQATDDLSAFDVIVRTRGGHRHTWTRHRSLEGNAANTERFAIEAMNTLVLALVDAEES